MFTGGGEDDACSTRPPPISRAYAHQTKAKRIFIKDMAQYLVPPTGMPVSIAPSLLAAEPKRGVGTVNGHVNGSAANGVTNGASGAHFNSCAAVPEADSQECPGARYPTVKERDNPTVVPKALLGQFHFAFLIRHPSRSVPSYYRCCIPPLDDVTGFKNYRPDEAGYRELVELFDYLRNSQLVGPKIAKSISELNGDAGSKPASATPDICIIDADDLLDKPQDTIEAFCRSVGIDFDPSMLNWDTEEDHEFAKSTFEKWPGFHDDAINSKDLKPRTHAVRLVMSSRSCCSLTSFYPASALQSVGLSRMGLQVRYRGRRRYSKVGGREHQVLRLPQAVRH